jgi:hypothetical protein
MQFFSRDEADVREHREVCSPRFLSTVLDGADRSISSKEHFKEIGWEQRPGHDAVIPGGLLRDHQFG